MFYYYVFIWRPFLHTHCMPGVFSINPFIRSSWKTPSPSWDTEAQRGTACLDREGWEESASPLTAGC